jgi:putative ABC transport system substrate-binding protein
VRRRQFITLLGGAAAAWPLAARAQQPGERVRRIGFLLAISQNDPVTQEYLAALAQGLAPLGWREGHNVQIETRLAGGEASRIRALATELASLSPDVILSHGTETSRIMQQASRMIPIVFTTVTDPIGSGLVASLAHPGGNITGFTNFEFSMAGKWLEFLKEPRQASET